MHLGALKVFCDVVRLRSFSQAAVANLITQSAASQIVAQLEKRLNVQLVDRSTRPLQLTSLGQKFYEGCKVLLDQYDELEAAIHAAQEQLASLLQVAAIYSVGLGDMSDFVHRFQTERPKAHVHIEYLHPNEVYEKVLEGTADLGLVSFPRRTPKLEALPWREEAMVLACAPQHRLAQQLAVRPKELAGLQYVHFDKDLEIRRQVDRFLRDQGVSVEVELAFDNIENIKQAVSVGAGVALLPEPTLRREVEAGTLVAVPLAGCRLVRPLGIIHRRRHKLNATAQRFVELLCQGSDGNGALGNGADAALDCEVHRPSKRGRNGAAR